MLGHLILQFDEMSSSQSLFHAKFIAFEEIGITWYTRGNAVLKSFSKEPPLPGDW